MNTIHLLRYLLFFSLLFTFSCNLIKKTDDPFTEGSFPGGDGEGQGTGSNGMEEDVSGKLKVEISGNFTDVGQGTEIIMIDGVELKPTEIKITDSKLVATTKWQGAESINFEIWLTTSGNAYTINCYLEGSKLNSKELTTETLPTGALYCNFIYPDSNE